MTPTDALIIVWAKTDYDIEVKIKLKLGFEHSVALENYNNLATVASAIFGKDKSSKQENVVSSKEDMMAALKGI